MASPSTVPPLVLVTGATGFLASHIIQRLLRTGDYVVRGSVRNANNEQKMKTLHQLCQEYPLQIVEADLLDSESWISAVEGCKYVIHVASPFPATVPKNEDEVIKPAVEGTRNVLEACVKAAVTRVVLTSSAATIMTGNQDKGHMLMEKDWAILDRCTPYEKSKVLAEQAAWKFVEDMLDEKKMELVVLNPGFLLGPILHNSTCTSMEIHRRLLQREMPMLPKLQLPLADVRDVSEAHVKALTLPNVVGTVYFKGNRYIVSSGSMWMRDWAKTLEREFKDQGYSIPTSYCPKVGLQVASFFDKSLKSILPHVGKVTNMSNDKMVKELDITPIEMEKSIIDMAYSLIDHGFIKKTAKYRNQQKD